MNDDATKKTNKKGVKSVGFLCVWVNSGRDRMFFWCILFEFDEKINSFNNFYDGNLRIGHIRCHSYSYVASSFFFYFVRNTYTTC